MSSGRRNAPQDAGNHRTEPFYTNEDVAILHNIVVLAQGLLSTLPDGQRLPTNALFEAYYDVLPRNGLNVDHDNRYARVLFKIGGVRGDGTLYEKFEEVLSRMGIDIEFDEAEADSDDQYDNRYGALEDTEEIGAVQDENVPPHVRARRNSDSAWNLGIETPAKAPRRNSYSSYNKAKVPPVHNRQGFLREVLQPQPRRQLPEQDGDLPGSNVGAWLNAKPAPLHRERRRRSSSIPVGVQIGRRSPSVATGRPPLTATSHANSDECKAESEITAVTSAYDSDKTESIDIPQERIPSKPSASLMQTKAEVISRHHLSSAAKCQLRAWRDQAIQRQEERVSFELIAIQHDQNSLLFQALDNWHKRYLEKQSVAQTERFFAHLERRSVKARDFYVLHKALTHWHGSACEEAERSRAARRHILRTRIFNAWRDITAVNELKVRRKVLQKFFGVWQRKQTTAWGCDTLAAQKYEGNLVEKVFMQWARKVWDAKATKYWTEGVKLRTLSLWKLAAQKDSDGHRTATEERRLQLAWNAWRIWKVKTKDHVNQDQQAETFRQTCLCISAIRKWRSETKVVPAKKAVQTEVVARLLRNTFTTWLHCSRHERQAAAIDRMRILREAWTNWRLKSRLQLLHSDVNHRIIWNSIYKWILAKNLKIIRQKQNGNMLHKCLQHWAKRAGKSKYDRWEREDLAQQFDTKKTHRLVLRHWAARSQDQQQLDVSGLEIHALKLSQRHLSKWSENNSHLRQLQQWSRDAGFYFLTSKTLKRWRSSTEASKREKRKIAYAQVRRTTKMNLGRELLLVWLYKAQKALDMHAQAQESAHNKKVIIGMETFDRWRARTEELGEMESMWQERVLRNFVGTWKDRSVAFQDLKREAIINFQERQQGRAIKKWVLVVLQIRGRSIQAAEVQEKNAKRTFRRMFNYWHQKAAEMRPTRRIKVLDPGGSTQGATVRVEAWSEFGDEESEWARGLDEPSATTLLPGYLNTPSRRTERVVAAAARFSSTTPRAPLSTPFEKHLRAQYSGGLPTLRRPLGKSILRSGGGYSDIADRSDKGREP